VRAPAKALSLPVTTIAPTSGSLSNCFRAALSSVMRPPQSALRAFGRFSVISAMLPSFFSVRMNWNSTPSATSSTFRRVDSRRRNTTFMKLKVHGNCMADEELRATLDAITEEAMRASKELVRLSATLDEELRKVLLGRPS
jgi:hypothetical protein